MNALIERLRAIRSLETGEQMDEFDQLVSELAQHEPLDPAMLPDLFVTFIDSTAGDEVMWSLLHLVEDFPGQPYASALVETLPQMVPHAREWSMRLLKRMLNSDIDRPLLRTAYVAASEASRQLVAQLLAEIVAGNKAFAAKVAEVTAGARP